MDSVVWIYCRVHECGIACGKKTWDTFADDRRLKNTGIKFRVFLTISLNQQKEN